MNEPSNAVLARVFVPGRARTKGSLKPIHRKAGPGRCTVSLTEDHALSGPWKKAMMRALAAHVGESGGYVSPEPYTEAVEVDCFFRFHRELSAAGDGVQTYMDGVWPSHRTLWPTAPDIGDEDKLRRNVLDALTQAHVITDDAMVVGGQTWKRWTQRDEWAGVLIVVRPARSVQRILRMEGWAKNWTPDGDCD